MKIINKNIVSILLLFALIFSNNGITVLASQNDVFDIDKLVKEEIVIKTDDEEIEKTETISSNVLNKEDTDQEEEQTENKPKEKNVEEALEDIVSTNSVIIIDDTEEITTSTNNDTFGIVASDSDVEKFQKRKNYGHLDPGIEFPVSKPRANDIFGLPDLPSSYDARNEKNSSNMSIIPPIRNQGSYGTCWAHSTIGMIETSIRKQDFVDNEQDSNLSEAALAFFVYNVKNVTDSDNASVPNIAGRDYEIIDEALTKKGWSQLGGSPVNATIVMSSYMGVVVENDDTKYENMALIEASGLDGKYAYHNNDYELFETQWINKNNIDLVKQAILENGSAGIGYCEGRDTTNCHQSGGEWYYYPEADESNHDVMIVGWDDNISKDLFYNSAGEKPTRDGGWLIRNSWGSNPYMHNNGYFWVSYEDQTLDKNIYSIKVTKAGTYKYNYHYDSTGILFYQEIKKDLAAANMFKVTDDFDQTLDAVLVGLNSANSEFYIDIYTKDTEMQTPLDGTIQLSQKVYKDSAGMYTIVLDNKIPLKKGSYFSIIVRNESDNPIIVLEDGINNTQGREVHYYNEAALKQSYVCAPRYKQVRDENSQGLTNINGIDYGYNFRIKALTNIANTGNGPKDYILAPDWFDSTEAGKTAEDITSITISQYPSSAPTDYDKSWNISSSNGLIGYIKGTEVTIYASQEKTIYMAEDSSYLFSDEDASNHFDKLTKINNLKLLDTSKVTNMKSMFEGCQNISTIDLSNFDTSKVTNMSKMFYFCNNMDSLDVSKFNTGNVTDFSNMFFSCRYLDKIDVSKFDTSKAVDISGMFSSCAYLLSIDVSNFNTSNVTDMSNLFSGCQSLTQIDLSKFDTSKVTNMQSMFYFMNKNKTNLQTINLSSFDTKEVTNMAQMFYNCSKLTTIIASDKFVTTKLTESKSDIFMFEECRQLKGGNQTTFDENFINKYLARIDGQNGFPGYFTGNVYHEVSFDMKGHGTSIAKQQVVDKGIIKKPANPIETGYEFKGWYDSDTYTTLFDFSKEITKTTIIYAKWEKEEVVVGSFDVNFDMKGHGTEVPKQTIKEGEKAIKPTDPIAPGYEFVGWYDSEAYTASFDFDKAITQKTYIYAKWTAITYTITYNTNDGALPTGISNTITKTYNEPTTLANPSKTGYKFAGWFSDSTLATAYDGNTDLSTTKGDTKNIYAKWEPISYKIKYDIPSGITATAPTQYEKHYNQNYTPANPTNISTGYRFVSWHTATPFTDANKYTGNTDLSTKENEEITLYSKWEVLFTYNANGQGVAPANEWVEYDNTIVLASPSGTTNGYTFEGWFSEKTGGVSYGKNGVVYTVKTPTIAYAHWAEKGFSIIYHNVNDEDFVSGYNVPRSRNYSEEIKLPLADDLYRKGYYFCGWFENPEFTGDIILGIDKNTAKDCEYWCKWCEREYNIYLNDNGGTYATGYNKPDKRKYTESKTLPTKDDIKKTGYNFDGWYAHKDYSGDKITEALANTDAHLFYYAKWIPAEYNVTLETNGGVINTGNIVSYKHGTTTILPTDVTKSDGIFKGWWTADGSNGDWGQQVTAIKATDAGDIKLFAKWSESFVVTFKLDGKGSDFIQNVEKGENVKKPTNPSYIDQEFLGWYTDNTYQTVYDFNSIINTQGIEIWAKWQAATTHEISFIVTNNGVDLGATVPDNQYVKDGQKAIRPENPKTIGWTFDDWYQDYTYQQKYTFNESVTAPKTLYGKWIENKYKINYIVNGGTWDQGTDVIAERNYTDSTSLITTISKRYHTFGGWYDNDVFEGTAKTTIPANTDEEVTIYAKWIQDSNTYTIRFDLNYDGLVQEEVFSNTENISLISSVFKREGYKIAGWKDKNGKVYDNSSTSLNGEVLFAIWVKQEVSNPVYDGGSTNIANTGGHNGSSTGGSVISQSKITQQQNANSQSIDNYQVHTNVIQGEKFIFDPVTNKMKISNQNLKAGFYNIDTGIGGAMYCIDENGNMKTGFVEYQGNIYYMDERQANLGRMFVGEVVIDNYKFVFDASGKCISGKENYQQVLQQRQALQSQQAMLNTQQQNINQLQAAQQAAQQIAQQAAIQAAMKFAQFNKQNAWNSIINMIGTKPFLIQ